MLFFIETKAEKQLFDCLATTELLNSGPGFVKVQNVQLSIIMRNTCQIIDFQTLLPLIILKF